MVKKLIAGLLILSAVAAGFAKSKEKRVAVKDAKGTKVATTYKTKLTELDMVDIFFEEIKKSEYIYKLYTYEVYTEEKKQNYSWEVRKNSARYIDDGEEILGDSVTLYTNNGKISCYTFEEATEIENGKFSLIYFLDYDYDLRRKLSDNVEKETKEGVNEFIKQSAKWLSRWKKAYSRNELLALDSVLVQIEYSVIKGGTGSYINDIALEFAADNDDTLLNMCLDAGLEKTTDGIPMFACIKTYGKPIYDTCLKIQKCLELGFDVNERYGEVKITVFEHFLRDSREGSERIVQLLIANGADVRVKGTELCPLAVEFWTVQENCFYERIGFLSELHKERIEKNKKKESAQCLKNAALLVKYGADVNGNGLDSNDFLINELHSVRPMLYIYAEDNNTELVKFLLDNGADVNIQFNGKTPLQVAAENNNAETVALLKKYGAK